MNQKQQNHQLRADTSRRYWCGTLTGLIFALDSAVVKSQNLFSSRGGFLPYAMYHHRERTKSINLLG